MTVSYWQTEQVTHSKKQCDVCIIGAGLIGTTAALMLREQGRQALLVDRGGLGMQASSRNAGFMLRGLDLYYHQAIERFGAARANGIWKVSEATIKFWRQMADPGDIDTNAQGSVLLAASPKELEDIKLGTEALHKDGFEAQFVEGDALSLGFEGALFQPNDGAVHPLRLVRSLFAKSGADLLEHSEVFSIERISANKIMVKSRLADIEAKQVLICTNAWSDRVLPEFQNQVVPVRAQVLSTGPVPKPIMKGWVGYADYGKMYFRDLPSGFLLGGARLSDEATEHNTTEDKVNPKIHSALDKYLDHHFSAAKEAGIARRWSGIMGFTKNGLPQVGFTKDGFAYAVGMNGHGLSLGAAVAEEVVTLLQGRTGNQLFTPDQDLSQTRFGSNLVSSRSSADANL